MANHWLLIAKPAIWQIVSRSQHVFVLPWHDWLIILVQCMTRDFVRPLWPEDHSSNVPFAH